MTPRPKRFDLPTFSLLAMVVALLWGIVAMIARAVWYAWVEL